MVSRDKRVTLQDVAKDAGVSRATASLVVRGSKAIKPSTSAKVWASIEKLGYVYDRVAASFRSQRSSTVGVIITDIENPFFPLFLSHIQNELYERNYTVLLGMSFETKEKQQRALETMLEHRVSALLLAPVASSTPNDFSKLKTLGLPTVLIGREVQGTSFDYIGTDYKLGVRLAIEHLISHGHRRIAYLGGMPGNSAYKERMDGFCSALQEYGIAVDPALIVPSLPNRDGGEQAISQVLQLQDKPTACFCHNDIVAFGVIKGLQQQGLIPGEHMAIVGFDNIKETETSKPQLTTVSVSPEQWGIEAARLTIERMEEHDMDAPSPRKVIVPPRLVVRESSVMQGQL